MILGIGTDIVRIARMEASLARHGERFAERLLAPEEMAEFRASAKPAAFLAKRFAAKEAVAKAMGTGFRDGLSLRHIAVAHEPKGRPYLVFTGRAAEMLEALGAGECHLSLADEQDMAIAFVTLLKRTP
ncbi:MAG: holo-ACP synthase [Thiohalomonadaceae bacterium]